ncbi:MAG TPA: (Fe-S)-binding protein [Bacillota bacterium]|nr:(Fe-S)-binding protein [Bacillota bacterium]
MKVSELKPSRWRPPGKNCGLCGEESCKAFLSAVADSKKNYPDCPYYEEDTTLDAGKNGAAIYTGKDVLDHPYDFVLSPLPGEISARKIVLPFRSDLVDKLEIQKDDYVLGRPMGAGCPVPHVLKVIQVEPLTGLLYTWVMGPKYARENPVKDLQAYHMIGFEGIATRIHKEPSFGCRVTFLPGFCMMNVNHTGLVNMILEKAAGLHLRIEDIRILAGKDNS